MSEILQRRCLVLSSLLLAQVFSCVAEEAVKPRLSEKSYWVVTNAYVGKKRDTSSVGQFVIFENGHLYLITPKGETQSMKLTPSKGEDGERFELFEEGRRVAIGLLTRDGEALHFYVNQTGPNEKGIPPEAKLEKSEELLICLAISEKEGKAKLAEIRKGP